MKNFVKIAATMIFFAFAILFIGAGFRDGEEGVALVNVSHEKLDVLEEASSSGANEVAVDILYHEALEQKMSGAVTGWTNRMIAAHELADSARELGVPDDDPIIVRLGEIWRSDYTDLQMIAKTISREAGSCPYWHMVAVGAVVLNRVNDSRFPDTVYGVLVQPNQYSAAYTSNFIGISSTHYAAAIDAMNGNHDVPANVVFQAEFVQGKGIWKTSAVNTGWYSSVTYFCY